jgi:hypothetical protein
MYLYILGSRLPVLMETQILTDLQERGLGFNNCNDFYTISKARSAPENVLQV